MRFIKVLSITTPQVREFIKGNYDSYIFVDEDYPISIGDVIHIGLSDDRDAELVKDSDLLSKDFKVSEIKPFESKLGIKVKENDFNPVELDSSSK